MASARIKLPLYSNSHQPWIILELKAFRNGFLDGPEFKKGFTSLGDATLVAGAIDLYCKGEFVMHRHLGWST